MKPQHSAYTAKYVRRPPTFYPHMHVYAPLLCMDREDLRASVSQEAVVDLGFWVRGMALDGS